MIGMNPKHHPKETCPVNMNAASEKVSIFETIKGPHDMRFVAFKDISEQNSKYSHQPMQVNVE